ncbi:MAG: hypothetical protein LBR56_04950 [Sporomusaceae bacterium]|nr:hypothetical protein [Sporomusaceae bacterium]
MKPVKAKKILSSPKAIQSKKTPLIPILNDQGQTVYVTERQLDILVEKQRKGWEELRGLWEDKENSFFDLSGK